MKNKCLAAIVSVLMMVSFPAVVFAQPIRLALPKMQRRFLIWKMSCWKK